MVRYLKGRILSTDDSNSSNAIYVHKKCLEWAPKIWFDGDIVMNLEKEIRRASKLRCRRCGLLGAALGCYEKNCRKSYHVPCAVQIIDCRWDVANRHVLCREHVSKILPCDKLQTHIKENYSSSLSQSHYSCKEEPFTNFEEEGQQSHLHNTISSFLPAGKCADKEGNLYVRHRETQQTDQINTSNTSSFPQSCHPAEGISNVFQGEETTADQPDTSSHPPDQLVFFGLSLSVSEKDSLQYFASSTNATLTEEWSKDVTHVIVAKGVAGWLGTLPPDPEAAYEVAFSKGSVRTIDGPKKGRMRAAEGGPNLFSGLCFCLSDYMNPDNRDRIRDLIAAAEGRVLEKHDMHLQLKNSDDSSMKPYFVYDVDVPRKYSSRTLHKEMKEASEHVAAGVQLICHDRVLDAIAAYDADILNVKGRFTQ